MPPSKQALLVKPATSQPGVLCLFLGSFLAGCVWGPVWDFTWEAPEISNRKLNPKMSPDIATWPLKSEWLPSVPLRTIIGINSVYNFMLQLPHAFWYYTVFIWKVSAVQKDYFGGRLGGSVAWASDFRLGHDLEVREFRPQVRLCANSSEPGACFRFCLPLALSAPPPLMPCLCRSKMNKH